MRASIVISDKSIKVVKVQHSKPVLLRIPLEGGVVQDGIIKDETKLKNALLKLARQSHLAKDDVVLGISEKHIFGKALVVADHGPDLEAKIHETVASYVPAVAQSYTDWQVLEKDEEHQKIFVASVPASFLDSYLTMLESLGIHIVGVEPLAFALSRHLPKIQQPPSKASFIVVLDESEILLTIVNKDGGIELTSVLPQETIGHPDEVLSEVATMGTFYDKKTQKEKIGRVFITGEGAEAVLKDKLASQLGVPSDFLQIQEQSIGQKDALTFFPVAALADLPVTFPKSHEHINLLAEEALVAQEHARKKAVLARFFRTLAVSLGSLCLLYAATLGFLFWEQYKAGREITQLRESIKAGNSSKVRKEIGQVNQYVGIAKKLLQKDAGEAITTLSFLSEKTPGGITITQYSLDLTKNTVLISGLSVERERLVSFGQILEEGEFKNVKIPLTSLEKKGASAFSLSFELVKQ